MTMRRIKYDNVYIGFYKSCCPFKDIACYTDGSAAQKTSL